MKVPAKLEIALALFAVLLLGLFLRPADGLSPTMKRMIGHELSRATTVGFPVRLVSGEGKRPELVALGERLRSQEGGRTSYILVSDEDIALVATPAFLALVRLDRWAQFQAWIDNPVAMQDMNAAVQAVAWAFDSVLIDAGKLPALPPLPPMLVASLPSAIEGPAESAYWGLPLALLLFIGRWFLGMRKAALL